MAAVGTYLSYLGYINTIEENGVVKARLNFQANDRFGNLSVGRIGNVDFSDDMPSFISPGSNIKYEVESLGYESVTATGVLKIYPLTANTSYTMQGYDSAMTPTAEVSFTATPTNNNPRAKDLASGTLAESISASTTTLLVYVGEGSASTIKAVWPDTPFYASIMPASPSAGVPNSLDSEIVKVTAVGNDQVGNTALTVTRAQRGTTGKAFTAGAIVTNADYAEDAVLLGDDENAETPTPWVDAGDIIWSSVIDKIYPVGSIFMSATLSTPSDVMNALGGTWVAWGAGRVPVGVDTSQTEFDTVEETGGEKTHKLTIAEMPRHRHKIVPLANYSGSYAASHTSSWEKYNDPNNYTDYTGGDGYHNNLQPYITCYMYKRTA